MGKPFLIFAATILFSGVITRAAEQEKPTPPKPIDFPTAPKVLPPPDFDPIQEQEDLEERLAEKKARRKKDYDAKHPKPGSAERRDSALSREAEKDRPYRFMAQISLVYPILSVSGPRKNYTSEYTSHFEMFTRFDDRPLENWQPWYGWRFAPFAGTGTYKSTSGRYGFLYFGPMFGVGRLQPEGYEFNRDVSKPAVPPSVQPFKRRYGWMFMGGIALQSRLAATDETSKIASTDIATSKGFGLDGLGLWAEMTYSVVHFGALGTNYVTGIQLGDGKTFFWFGVAAGAWY